MQAVPIRSETCSERVAYRFDGAIALLVEAFSSSAGSGAGLLTKTMLRDVPAMDRHVGGREAQSRESRPRSGCRERAPRVRMRTSPALMDRSVPAAAMRPCRLGRHTKPRRHSGMVENRRMPAARLPSCRCGYW